MTTKRLILMLLVALISVTEAWADQETDYTFISHSVIFEKHNMDNLKTEANHVRFDTTPCTFDIEVEQAIGLSYYILTPCIFGQLTSTKVEGSNDKSSWTQLHFQTLDYNKTDATPHTMAVNCNTQYKYYRFTLGGEGSHTYLTRLQIFAVSLDGEGTARNPYLISKHTHLPLFHDVCATNPAACGKLMADFDFTNITWNSIVESPYTGTLDGNNHVISNLTASVGLFQNMGAATIKNLTIRNAYLTTTDEKSGVFASQANGATFENCIITGSISSNGTNAGGLVGNAIGCTFTKCYSVGNYSFGGTNAGALVGNADGSTTFNQCFAATNLDDDGDAYLPMCGGGNAILNNSYYYGTGSEKAVTKADVGGGRLAYLLNDGNITGPYFQRLGTDVYPHFTKTGDNYVYLSFDETSYSNICPHRNCTILPFTAPTCLGTEGNAEYGKCHESLCGKYFFASDRDGVTTNEKDFTLSCKAVNLEEHKWWDDGYWNFSAFKDKGGTIYYNVMDISVKRMGKYHGDYAISHTVMDNDPMMNLHVFFNADMDFGSFSVRFYVNGVERTAFRKDYPSSISEQHEILAFDGLHKFDCIKVVFTYNHEDPNDEGGAHLLIGTEKPLPTNHDLHKHELTYNCIDGGYHEHYECERCTNAFTQDTPFSDDDITTLSNLAIAPVGAHNYNPEAKQIESNLYGSQCQNQYCTSYDPENYVLRNYHNDTDMPLSYEGNSYKANEAVDLTDAKEYVTPVAFSAAVIEYSRTFYTNVWNPWFVPFNTTVEELEDNDVTDVACIESIHNYDTDNDGVVDKTVLEVIKKKNGTVKAGVPYMVKTEDSYAYPMAFTDKVMEASTNAKTVHTETGSAAYDFMGTYSGLTAREVTAANIFSLNGEGAMVHRTGKIMPLRWYMQEVSKDNVYEELSPAMSRAISIRVIGEEDETTGIRTIYPEDEQTEELLPKGIFDLNGRKLSAPQPGKINIINGKKQYVR